MNQPNLFDAAYLVVMLAAVALASGRYDAAEVLFVLAAGLATIEIVARVIDGLR